MSKAKHNHVVRNIPNTEENRKFIKKVNKMSKESDSIWKFFIKYRKPKEGFHYGSGGSLRCENANAFSVYIEDRRPYGKRPIDKVMERSRGHYDKMHKLELENEKLREELAIYKNPYNNWSISDIEQELFEIKEYIVEGYINNSLDNECTYVSVVDNNYKSITLREKYDLLMKALTYKQGEIENV